jgi:hypothetical protein
MPAPPGGPAGGGAGGGAGGSSKNYVDQLKDLIDQKEDDVEATKKQIDTDKKAGKSVDDLIKKLKDEENELKSLKKALGELTDKRDKEIRSLKYLIAAHKEGVTAYHQYNLSVQRAIDATGKFEGQSVRARQEFEQLRHSLNLTRQAAVEFSETWATGLRLGATNQQLEKMIGNLQKIHGQTQGLAMAREILATPMTRTTMQGVAGGNVGAVATAMRGASLQQAQALASTLRKPENRPAQTQEAVRFERTQAKVATVIDDLKAGMQAFMAQGIGSDAAAILPQLVDMGESLKEIKDSVKIIAGSNFLKGAANIPGIGGIAGKLLGGIGGGGLKAMGLRGVGFGAAGFAAQAGMNYIADRMQAGGTGQKLMRAGGWAAQGAGLGATFGIPGAAVGGGVGLVGGLASEFGGEWIKYVKESAQWWGTGVKDATNEFVRGITGVEEKKEKVDIGGILSEQAAAIDTTHKQLAALNTTLQNLPETLRASIAVRAGEVGVAAVGRGGIEAAQAAFAQRTAKSMDVIVKEINAQRSKAVEDRNNAIAKAKGIGATPAEVAAVEENAQVRFDTIEKELQDRMKGLDIGAGARLEMQRMETRRGHFGLEREAAAGRFRRTGAITGDLNSIIANRTEIDRTYAAETKLIEDGGKNALASLDAEQNALKIRMKQAQGDDALLRQLGIQNQELENQRLDIQRTVNNQKEINALNKMEAEIANERSRVTAYELTATYRRATFQRNMAKAQEEFARERGGTPEEVGGFARQAAAGSQEALNRFNATFEQSIEHLTEQAKAAREGRIEGGEAKAVQLEQEVYNLRQKGVELERAAYQDRIHAAIAEAQLRQEQFGVQKNILEVARDSAARTGQSWRVQMGIQSQIIAASRGELEAARAAFTSAKEAGESGLPLMQKQLAVVQKEAALREAIMGKQRDFLEKAIAAGFGMGGGTKALPNINPRVFGEVYKDVLGQVWQGRPMTIEQTRQAMGGNLRGGIGVGGGINAAPGRPGVNPAFGGPPAPAGMGEQAAGGPGAAGGVDVSGKFAIAVRTDTEMFKAQVEEIAVKAVMNKNKQGAIG